MGEPARVVCLDCGYDRDVSDHDPARSAAGLKGGHSKKPECEAIVILDRDDDWWVRRGWWPATQADVLRRPAPAFTYVCETCGRAFTPDDYETKTQAAAARAGHGRAHSEAVQPPTRSRTRGMTATPEDDERGLEVLFGGDDDAG